MVAAGAGACTAQGQTAYLMHTQSWFNPQHGRKEFWAGSGRKICRVSQQGWLSLRMETGFLQCPDMDHITTTLQVAILPRSTCCLPFASFPMEDLSQGLAHCNTSVMGHFSTLPIRLWPSKDKGTGRMYAVGLSPLIYFYVYISLIVIDYWLFIYSIHVWFLKYFIFPLN